MAGYQPDFSKSNSAIAAEDEGLMTLTAIAKHFRVSTEAIKAVLDPCEWHHSSKWYNRVDYYNPAEVEDDPELLEALKAYKPAPKTANEYRANVRWLEWSGSRNHPKATEHRAENILVTEKGQFYTFHLADGRDVRKKIGSSGTEVRRMS